MATDIDNLQIEIKASATDASKSIDKLVGGIEKLGNSLSGLNTSQATKQISALADSFKGLSGVKVGSVTSLAKQINQLGSMDTSGVRQMKTAIKAFSASVAELNNIKIGEPITQMAQLANAISRLGNKSATTAISNMPQLATGLKDVMSTLSDAPEVSQNLIDMTKALADFARTGTSGVKAAKSLDGSVKSMGKSFSLMPKIANSFTASIKKTVSGIKQIKSGILSAIGAFAGVGAIISGIKQSIEVASDLTEVQNVIDFTFAQYKSTIEDMASTSIQDFGISELAAKETAGRFQAMGTAAGIARGKMAEMSVSLTELSADMASFYNKDQSAVATSLQSVFTGETEPLRQYGLDLTQATLQEWAMKQGLDANISSMSQAEKIMLRYQYVLANTTAAQGDFSRTANTWSNQISILKMQLQQLAGVLGTAFINALKPMVQALNSALSAITQFAVKVINALGQIFGWKATTTNVGIADDFAAAEDSSAGTADNLGKAEKNAKKLKSHMLSIDELNVVEPDTSSDASGGSGGGAGGGASGGAGDDSAFQIEEIETLFESSIKSLEELGAYIGDALTSAMESINWDSVYEKASNFGAGLAKFLNGLISPELFSALGKTIANSINTALQALNSFGKTFNWENFGSSIAAGINSFFSNFNWSLLADTINTWAKGLLESLITALSAINWQQIGTGIGTFLAELDFLEIGKMIVEAIWLAIKGAWTVVEASFDVAPIETSLLLLLASPTIVSFGGKLVSALVEPLVNIGSTIANILTPLKKAFEILGSVISGVSTPTLTLTAGFAALVAGLGITYAKNEEVRKSFADATAAIKDGLQPAIEFVTNTLLPDLQTAWERLKEILSPFADFLGDVFVNIWQDMINPALKYIGETVLPLVTEAFENLWNNVIVPFGELLSDVFEPAVQLVAEALRILWENVVVPLAKAVGNTLGKSFESLVEIFNEIVVPALETVTEVFQFLWDEVLSGIVSFIKDTFLSVFKGVFESIGEIIGGLSKSFGELITFITGTFTSTWKKAWESVKDIFKGIFDSIASIAENILSSIKSKIDGVVSGIKNVASTIGGVASKAGSIVSKVGNAVGIKTSTQSVGGESGINIATQAVGVDAMPQFATGGFPEDGLFLANHSELVGKFSNGKTAVANNEQIIEGIARGVKEAVSEKLVPYLAIIADILSGLRVGGYDFTPSTQDSVVGAGNTGYSAGDAIASVDTENLNATKVALQEIQTVDFSGWYATNVEPYFSAEKWAAFGENIKSAIINSQISFIGQWSENMKNWWDSDVEPWFDIDKWNELLMVIPTAFATAFSVAGDVIVVLSNEIIGAVESTVNRAIDAINALIAAMNQVPGVGGGISYISNISLDRIAKDASYSIAELVSEKYTQAAMPTLDSAGSFIAESVAENENKAIESNNELPQDIADSTADAMGSILGVIDAGNEQNAELLRELIAVVREGKEITIDGRTIVSAYDQRKARNGFSFT